MTTSGEPRDNAPLDLSVLDGVAGGEGDPTQSCSSRTAHGSHIWALGGVSYVCPGKTVLTPP